MVYLPLQFLIAMINNKPGFHKKLHLTFSYCVAAMLRSTLTVLKVIYTVYKCFGDKEIFFNHSSAHHRYSGASGFSGMEWWNGMVEWTGIYKL